MGLTKINLAEVKIPVRTNENSFLSGYNDLTDALSNIATQYSNSPLDVEKRSFTLIIDEDCDLTGQAAGTITIPEYLTIIVQNGKRFITPLVARDTTGVQDTDNTITLSGTTGDAIVTIGANTYTVTFTTDLTTTASNFVTAEAANILTNNNLTVVANAGVLEFNGARKDYGQDFGIANNTGDLDGAVGTWVFNRQPITGTVADNYVQIQFDGKFEASPFHQCFEGDGLIWFGRNTVDHVRPVWWGLTTRSSGTPNETTQLANVRALQQATNCIVLDNNNRSTSSLKLPSGNIHYNHPFVALKCNLDGHPYLTGNDISDQAVATVIHIEGAEEIKHEINFQNTTNIYYTGKYASPIIIQGGRNVIVRNLRIQGENDARARDNEWALSSFPGINQEYVKLILRPWHDSDKIANAWINLDTQWGAKKPYCGLLFDPFKNTRQFSYLTADDVADSIIDLYHGVTNHQQTWAVKISDMHITRFVEGIVIAIHGQQNDTYDIDQIQFNNIGKCIAISQDQSRDVRVGTVMFYGNVFAGIAKSSGHGGGIYAEVHSMHTAGGCKYLCYGDKGNGSININNVYGELAYALGTNSEDSSEWTLNSITQIQERAIGAASFYSNLSNITFKFAGEPTFTYAGGLHWMTRPPTIKGANLTNCLIGGYTGVQFRFLQLFERCDLRGMVYGAGTPDIYPVDESWKKDWTNTNIVDLRTGGQAATALSKMYSAHPEMTHGGYTIRRNGINEERHDLEYKTLHRGSVVKARNKGDGITATLAMSVVDNTFCHNYITFAGDIPVHSVLVLDPDASGENMICQVVDNTAGTVTAACFSKEEITELIAIKDGSDQFVTTIYKMEMEIFRSPVCVSSNGNGNQVVIERYATYSTTGGGDSSTHVVGDLMLLPDGRWHEISDITGNVVTFITSHNETFTGFWSEPDFLPVVWRGLRQAGSSTRGYYQAGERYRLWQAQNDLTTDEYLICLKSGDAEAFTGGAEVFRADFAVYSKISGRLVAYYILSQSTATGIFSARTDIVESGNNANRPDNLSIPLEYIPNGFVYDNTEAAETQIFNGTAFVAV